MQHAAARPTSLFDVLSVPRFLTLDTAGIDIAPKSVCAMKLAYKRGAALPLAYKEVQLSETCELLETRDDLKRCEPLRAALQTVKAELKLTFVKVSLPEVKTYTFKTAVPVAAIPTIEDALTVKLQENVPLDPKDILYDFQILPQRGTNPMVDVVVTVFPKTVIEAYTDLLHEVGLFPVAFESESQSNARAVIDAADETSYLLLHMGYSKVSLAIVERGAVHYTSSMPYSSEEIVADFAAQPAQALKAKINTLLVYWFTNKHNPTTDEKISNTILTGPFATAPGLVAFLEQHLRINVDIANVWRNCFDVNEHVPTLSHAESLHYSTAIGLALLE
ncbi:MAG: type 4 fimbrial biosis protein PilM, type pilus assembly protein PilM [Candidatus Parcubacteria bacterium]|jgi:Tfp pilus assembly PilM family ATPase